jgi:hypothetical protein
MAVPQVLVSSHVCTPVPEHSVEPGVHEPMQAPALHDCELQGEGAAHVPSAPHICTP